MAFADAPDAFGRPFDRSVFLHGLNEIGAASGSEPAVWPQQRANKNLVQPNHADQQLAW